MRSMVVFRHLYLIGHRVWLLLPVLLTACVYRVDIQQGNLVTQEMIAKLKPGMTANLTFTDLTALPGTLFSYSLFPRCALGRSTVGTSDLGWCNILPPTGVTATDGTSNVLVLVQWDAALNATGYAVYRLDPASATGPVRIGSTRAAVRNFSDRTARPGKLYYYTVRSTVTQGESQPSLADAGWRNNPSGPNPVIPGGGAEMPMTDGGGRATGAASLTLAGPRNTEPTEPADGGGASNPQDADPLMAPIVATDAAWALDCEAASVAELRDAVRAGARDHDGNGEPDLCQRERGDLDLSGTVDEGDLALLLSMMGDSLPALGDFDHDGVIDREDLRLLFERIATERALPEMAAPARANTARSSTDPAR